MTDPCTKLMESQVKTEMEAAMKYLAMVYSLLVNIYFFFFSLILYIHTHTI